MQISWLERDLKKKSQQVAAAYPSAEFARLQSTMTGLTFQLSQVRRINGTLNRFSHRQSVI